MPSTPVGFALQYYVRIDLELCSILIIACRLALARLAQVLKCRWHVGFVRRTLTAPASRLANLVPRLNLFSRTAGLVGLCLAIDDLLGLTPGGLFFAGHSRGIVYVMACEWCLGCTGLTAPCFGSERHLSTLFS